MGWRDVGLWTKRVTWPTKRRRRSSTIFVATDVFSSYNSGNFVFSAWDFESQVDKGLTHAVELHPVQGQGAGRFRAGKVPHNDFGSQVDKALHAVELHPVQGQGAGRLRI